jgi:hypothetical protein
MKNNTDYFSCIQHKGDKYLIQWDKASNFFTIEDNSNMIVIYNGAINDLISELEKLRELVDEESDRPSKGLKK